MDHRMAADLDRYITGNFGQDQFMTTPYRTNEERAAEMLFEFIQDNQPTDFDLKKFIAALRRMLISEHQCAVRCSDDYTPEEYDFWEGMAYTCKERL